ncbi:MAG: SoxR reducing system RseC family protein [bacterium]
MIREKGKVIDCRNGLLKIRLDSKPSCHSCNLCDRGKEGMTMDVESDFVLSPGDPVYVEIEGRNLLLCFFMLYLFPVIIFISGVGFGAILSGIFSFSKLKEVFEIISGFIFFAAAYIYVGRFDKSYKKRGIVKINPVRIPGGESNFDSGNGGGNKKTTITGDKIKEM